MSYRTEDSQRIAGAAKLFECGCEPQPYDKWGIIRHPKFLLHSAWVQISLNEAGISAEMVGLCDKNILEHNNEA